MTPHTIPCVRAYATTISKQVHLGVEAEIHRLDVQRDARGTTSQ